MGLAVATPQAEPLQVVVTTSDLADLVGQLGGESIQVVPLVPGAVDPHSVMPKASMLIKLKRADALVSMGMGFEHAFLPALLEKSGRDDFGRGATDISQGGTRHLLASSFIGPPLEVPKKLDRSQGVDVHPLGNPHWNTDPILMQKVGAGVRDFLETLAPNDQAGIRSRWKKWDDQLSAHIQHWQAWLRPARGQAMVTYHRSWSYFARRFEVSLLGEVEPKPGMPPSTRHLAQLARTMKASGCKVLLMAPWYNEGKLGNLPKMIQFQIVKSASVSGREGYIAWMHSLVSQLAVAWGLPEPKGSP